MDAAWFALGLSAGLLLGTVAGAFLMAVWQTRIKL